MKRKKPSSFGPSCLIKILYISDQSIKPTMPFEILCGKIITGFQICSSVRPLKQCHGVNFRVFIKRNYTGPPPFRALKLCQIKGFAVFRRVKIVNFGAPPLTLQTLLVRICFEFAMGGYLLGVIFFFIIGAMMPPSLIRINKCQTRR